MRNKKATEEGGVIVMAKAIAIVKVKRIAHDKGDGEVVKPSINSNILDSSLFPLLHSF
jgi:hypothetical protein